jgi:hypothetical protein
MMPRGRSVSKILSASTKIVGGGDIARFASLGIAFRLPFEIRHEKPEYSP